MTTEINHSLILASASARRLALLQQIGIAPIEVIAADIDESPLRDELPPVYAARIARSKAQVVAQQKPGQLILAADTVVALGRRILPKSEDRATAQQCLQMLSGRRHTVITAVCLADAHGNYHATLVRTMVRFSRLDKLDIEQYLDSGEWQGKAGGYGIQGRDAKFIPFLSGSYTNVVGLPLHETVKLLQRAGAAI